MPSPNGHRAERECGCPPWAKWCAHFEGRTLWLSDREDYCTQRYSVLLGTTERCNGWRGSQVRMTGSGKTDLLLHDLPAAEAEFREREAALLGAVDA